MPVYLKDENVSLRALEPEDIDLLFTWENDESLWHVSHTLAPYSRQVLAQYLRDSDRDIFAARQLRLMIVNREGDTVGAIDLFDFDPVHARAGIGILVYKRSDRSRGYATAALNLLIGYCFKKLSLHQLYANILPENEISIKLFSQAGFVATCLKKEWIRDGDSWSDELLFQLVRKG